MGKFKNIMKTIGVIVLYLFIISCCDMLLFLVGINFNDLSLTIKQAYIIFMEILLIAFLIYIFRDSVISNFKYYFKNIKKYLTEYTKYWILALILIMLSNSIINQFTTTDISNNQQMVLDEMNKFPIYMVIMTVFIAPVLEEFVFRLNIRKMIPNNDYLYIIISGVLFGLMHVLDESTLINYLYLIPYSIPGIIFAYTLKKSNNIFVPISLHFFNNLLSTLFLFL